VSCLSQKVTSGLKQSQYIFEVSNLQKPLWKHPRGPTTELWPLYLHPARKPITGAKVVADEALEVTVPQQSKKFCGPRKKILYKNSPHSHIVDNAQYVCFYSSLEVEAASSASGSSTPVSSASTSSSLSSPSTFSSSVMLIEADPVREGTLCE